MSTRTATAGNSPITFLARISLQLNLLLGRCASVISEFDPAIQAILVFLIINVTKDQGVFSFDKHAFLAIGMLASMMIEELI